jgi:hypothetical protein
MRAALAFSRIISHVGQAICAWNYPHHRCPASFGTFISEEIGIAVGMHLTMQPPAKAVRAAFPHTASTLGKLVTRRDVHAAIAYKRA